MHFMLNNELVFQNSDYQYIGVPLTFAIIQITFNNMLLQGFPFVLTNFDVTTMYKSHDKMYKKQRDKN